MSHIKTRVLFLFFCGTIMVVSFGTLTTFTFIDYKNLLEERERSYTMVDQTILLRKRELSTILKEDLEQAAQKLKPEFRGKALLSAIKSPTQGNIEFLLKSENEYRNYIKPMISYLSQRLILFFIITIYLK